MRADQDTLLVLSDRDIRQAMDPAAAVVTQKQAYRAVAADRVRLHGSTATAEPEHDSLVFALTGAIRDTTGIVCKFGYQAPENTARGLPTVHAFVNLLDPVTGVPVACLNGTTVTTMRTAAGLGAAADALAGSGARTLAVIGSGVQARETCHMIAAVRDLAEIRVWSPSRRREELADELDMALSAAVSATTSARAAVAGADIIATCTASRDPVLEASWLAAGSTVLTMGSYLSDRREVGLDTTRRAARVYVDDVTKTTAQCGPVLEAIEAGHLDAADLLAIGDVIGIGGANEPCCAAGRRDEREILVFHSVGVGVQDAAFGWAAYQNARAQCLGVTTPF